MITRRSPSSSNTIPATAFYSFVGAVLGLIAIIGLVFYLRYRRPRSHTPTNHASSTQQQQETPSSNPPPPTQAPLQYPLPTRTASMRKNSFPPRNKPHTKPSSSSSLSLSSSASRPFSAATATTCKDNDHDPLDRESMLTRLASLSQSSTTAVSNTTTATTTTSSALTQPPSHLNPNPNPPTRPGGETTGTTDTSEADAIRAGEPVNGVYAVIAATRYRELRERGLSAEEALLASDRSTEAEGEERLEGEGGNSGGRVYGEQRRRREMGSTAGGSRRGVERLGRIREEGQGRGRGMERGVVGREGEGVPEPLRIQKKMEKEKGNGRPERGVRERGR